MVHPRIVEEFEEESFVGEAQAEVGEVGSDAHGAKLYGFVEEVVLRDAAALAPAAGEVGTKLARAHLLAVAIDAPQRDVDLLSLLREAGPARWIKRLRAFDELLFLAADLELRCEHQPGPGKGDGSEHTEEDERGAIHVTLLETTKYTKEDEAFCLTLYLVFARRGGSECSAVV